MYKTAKLSLVTESFYKTKQNLWYAINIYKKNVASFIRIISIYSPMLVRKMLIHSRHFLIVKGTCFNL